MKNSVLYIWLQQAIGIYSRLAREIFLRFNSIEEIYRCDDFSFLGEKHRKYIKRLEAKETTEAFEVFKRCEALGVEVTGFYSELYPEKLKTIEIPPVALYSIGNFKNLNKMPCIAIVGTRKMTDCGKEVTEKFARGFAQGGVCVVSGLAKGIDTAAHRGAVMANGYTVAVLGNPIGDIYPKENLKAFETLYKCGLVMSELYPGAPRTRADFPNRNRIISGISDAVVISEAGEKSGALITARHAIAQGRPIFAVPFAVGAEGAGSNALIKQGVTAVTEANEVLSALLLEYPEGARANDPAFTEKLNSYGNTDTAKKSTRAKEKPKPKDEIKQTAAATEAPPVPEERGEAEEQTLSTAGLSERILAVLKGRKPLSADEIAIKTGLPISEVLAELTYMEIDGSIIASAGGRFISSRF